MGLTTRDPIRSEEETEIHKILKFCIYRADLERDKASQKLYDVRTLCPPVHISQ